MAAREMRPWRADVPSAATRGRRGTWAEGVWRLLLMKTSRTGATLEREGRANLVYRDLKRVGASKPPDAKPWGAGD